MQNCNFLLLFSPCRAAQRGLVWSHNPRGSQIIAKKVPLLETTGGAALLSARIVTKQRVILSRWVYELPPMIEP